MTKLTRSELLDMRSVLERSLQRVERSRRLSEVFGRVQPDQDEEARTLAAAVADLNDELAGMA
jgi:hypothetical protein